MVKDQMNIQNRMAEETNICIMVRRIWMMRLILTLVGMATTTMLQLLMNPMDLASKRMGKVAYFLRFYNACISTIQQMNV